jgi:hypothetical protein
MSATSRLMDDFAALLTDCAFAATAVTNASTTIPSNIVTPFSNSFFISSPVESCEMTLL